MRHVVDIHLTEHAHLAELRQRVLLVAQAVELSAAVRDGVAPHAGAERKLLSGVLERVVAVVERIVEHGLVGVSHADVNAAYVPRAVGALRASFGGQHLELHVVGALNGVGAESGVGCVEEVVTVFAQKRLYAGLLAGEVDHAEGIVLLQQAFRLVCTKGGVDGGGIVEIGNGVEAVELSGMNLITHLGLFLVALRDHVVAHFAVEVAVVVERIGGHFGAHFGTHAAHEHRVGTKVVEEPLAESALAVVEGIVHPQTDLERRVVVGRTEEGIVWRIGQDGFHFRFGRGKVGFGLFLLFAECLAFGFGEVFLVFGKHVRHTAHASTFEHVAHGFHGMAHGGDDTHGVASAFLAGA